MTHVMRSNTYGHLSVEHRGYQVVGHGTTVGYSVRAAYLYATTRGPDPNDWSGPADRFGVLIANLHEVFISRKIAIISFSTFYLHLLHALVPAPVPTGMKLHKSAPAGDQPLDRVSSPSGPRTTLQVKLVSIQ